MRGTAGWRSGFNSSFFHDGDWRPGTNKAGSLGLAFGVHLLWASIVPVLQQVVSLSSSVASKITNPWAHINNFNRAKPCIKVPGVASKWLGCHIAEPFKAREVATVSPVFEGCRNYSVLSKDQIPKTSSSLGVGITKNKRSHWDDKGSLFCFIQPIH